MQNRWDFRFDKLICASNDNKVLYDFFRTGTYDRKRDFILTTSPSMDILISSNLERLIYRIAGGDAKKCAELMQSLYCRRRVYHHRRHEGTACRLLWQLLYRRRNSKKIAEIFKDSHYVIDTHTAVAAGVYDKYVKDTNDTTPTVIASTASPYKFTRSVMEALGADTDGKDDFALADELSALSGVKLPQAVETIRTAPVLHNRVVDAPDMPKAVKDILESDNRYCSPVHSNVAKIIPDCLRQWNFGLYVSGFWHIHAKTPRG